jgi:hypothetical protein
VAPSEWPVRSWVPLLGIWCAAAGHLVPRSCWASGAAQLLGIWCRAAAGHLGVRSCWASGAAQLLGIWCRAAAGHLGVRSCWASGAAQLLGIWCVACGLVHVCLGQLSLTLCHGPSRSAGELRPCLHLQLAVGHWPAAQQLGTRS